MKHDKTLVYLYGVCFGFPVYTAKPRRKTRDHESDIARKESVYATRQAVTLRVAETAIIASMRFNDEAGRYALDAASRDPRAAETLKKWRVTPVPSADGTETLYDPNH